MPLRRKSVGRLAIAGVLVCVMAVAGVGWVTYSGGYWESWPFCDRISGPQRFRQYVADPLPPSVHGPRGGYSGFPFGYIKTCFKYSDDSLPFLGGWTHISSPENESKIAAARFSYTKVFGKNNRVFVLINENTKQGCLYVPGG